ncbi:MAG: hypothetical protein EP344_17050 [Bacteroidetes bacterium]|nr:MAG: hypothetical protein EP344_17050 [Bacteroidota bacterium]
MKTKPVSVKVLEATPQHLKVKLPAVHVPVSIDRAFFNQWLESGQVQIRYMAPFRDPVLPIPGKRVLS